MSSADILRLHGVTESGRLIGNSRAVQLMEVFAKRAALKSDTILIEGESGSGKDHFAARIHRLGREARPFVALNCGGIAANLLESELFGHKAGAYTDARTDKVGLIRIAEKGTLFLNEAANMDGVMQARFLQLLDGGTYRPVGGVEEFSLNTRIIVATNADLETMVQEGRFREDLYYRLDGIRFRVPSLRERQEDIPELAMHFLDRTENGQLLRLSEQAIKRLQEYSWPGNIRQLKKVIERAAFQVDQGVLQPEHFELPAPRIPQVKIAPKSPEPMQESASGAPLFKDPAGNFLSWESVSDEIFKDYLLVLMREHQGNQSQAAKTAGFTRSFLRKHLRRFSIQVGFQVTDEEEDDD